MRESQSANCDVFLKIVISIFRSWDLNKICYKSGVPIIENVMIERVSSKLIE